MPTVLGWAWLHTTRLHRTLCTRASPLPRFNRPWNLRRYLPLTHSLTHSLPVSCGINQPPRLCQDVSDLDVLQQPGSYLTLPHDTSLSDPFCRHTLFLFCCTQRTACPPSRPPFASCFISEVDPTTTSRLPSEAQHSSLASYCTEPCILKQYGCSWGSVSEGLSLIPERPAILHQRAAPSIKGGKEG